jgi:isochorismate synthase
LNSIPHHAREEFADWLSWRLDGLLRARQPARAPGLLSITLELPGFRLRGVPRLQEGDFYWAHPEGGSRLLGRGLSLAHQCSGAERLGGLSGYFRHIQAHWRHMDPDGSAVQPLMFTGFAFDPADPMDGLWQGFPNSGLFVPELLLRQQGDACRLVLSCRDGLLDVRRQVARWLELVGPVLDHEPERGGRRRSFRNPGGEPVPADAQWLALGRGALEAIERGLVHKLVLYRRVRLGAPADISVRSLAAAMEAAHPGCRLFAMVRNGRTLISASPERLIEKRGRQVLSDVLAGTAPRSRDATRDGRLAQSLRDSNKDRLEHRLVEDAVAAALAPLCSQIRAGATPRVQRLRNVQHLWNEVRGVLRGSENLLDVAARLHPTPAVNGSPGPAALDWLRRHGQARRGWYCGGGGWIDRNGDGELSVLLRCALVRDGQADLFAGAGLVAGSEPTAELEETELKLAAVLDALGNARGQGLV